MKHVQSSVAAEGRLRWLARRLDEAGSVTISDAAGALEVSEMTIRRDLLELEERGTARRVRGGATAVGPQTFAERHGRASRAKSRIAAKLAQLVPATGTIGLDASSTVMRVVPALAQARDLTVVTNGPDTFAALQTVAPAEALLTGGRLDPRTGSLVGALACRTAEQFAVDVLFASAAAVDPEVGALEVTVEEGEVKRSLARRAARVVLAADASKLDSQAAAVGLEWEHIDVLVTDLAPDDRRVKSYRRVVEVR
jgi:DeoR family transcriptional regulator, fructose operon transcriptional repressor